MQKRVLPTGEVAMASKIFEKFFQSMEFEDIMAHFRDLCDVLGTTPGSLTQFYPVLKANVKSMCGVNLFQVLDRKISNDSYNNQYACPNMQVVIVGCGPCGLRTAVEAVLLGARVIVCEKRKSFTRNNVLHLWPYVIEDLKLLGVKNFFPKFCTGSMNHISIRRLQSVLLKVALVLGVRVYEGVEFCDLVEPSPDSSSMGWRVKVNPSNHPLNRVNIDMLIGAEGKRVTIPGFKRKEFRGKLAIAITANFKNNRTTAEAVVEEISGVAFVYKQDFFNNLYEELGIALENIVYYKDETHYFVMTTKKHSLLDRGVLLEDHKDPIELLSARNTNKQALLEYIKDACDYCTDYQLPDLQFELNHHGEPDVALFDFTSMFAASNSTYVKEKHGKQLILTLVGDGLLEPFWPTGSGCARGFLGCMDACYVMQEWSLGTKSVLEILAERESIFRLLPQTTSENIAKDYKNYTVNPTTRYPNLNKYLYSTHQMAFLYQSDDDSKGLVPRRDYTSACNEIQTHVPSFSSRNLSQQLQPVNRKRADSLEIYDDSGSSSGSPQVEHRDLKSRMKALMEAANGGNKDDNDLDKYVTNRAKLRERANQIETKKTPSQQRRAIVKDDNKVDRQMAMEKISQTFGYGENKKPERPALMSAKDRQAENRRQAVQKQNSMPEISRPKKKSTPAAATSNGTKIESATKTKSNKSSSRKGVQKWDFNCKPKCSPSLDNSIDPELDSMLAELESDEDFKKLSDNDQLAWLESLFYLDTPTKQASSKLVKPKPAVEMPRRREKSALSLYSSKSVDSPDCPSSVSAKTFSVQGSNRSVNRPINPPSKPVPQSPALKPPLASVSSSTTEEAGFCPSNREAGLNKDLCSLAAQFFNQDNSKSKPKQTTVNHQRRISTNNPPTQQNSFQSKIPDRKSFPPPKERAFFQPTGDEVEEEEEEIPLPTGFQFNHLKKNATPSPQLERKPSRSSPPQEEGAPPIPMRSGEPKMLMLKLMKNATNVLKN